jgi:hypothetical protein
MNSEDILHHAVSLLGIQVKKPVPALLQPIRDIGNDFGDTFASLRPNSTTAEWGQMNPIDKLAAVAKAAISFGGEGVMKGAANGLASSLSVSPPAQLAEYALGNPDPTTQLKHGIEGALTALSLGKYLEPTEISKEYMRNAVGQFAKKPIQWVSDLMGGVQ